MVIKYYIKKISCLNLYKKIIKYFAKENKMEKNTDYTLPKIRTQIKII